MNFIKKLFSYSKFTIPAVICIGIIVFRVVDIWSGFAFSDKYLDPIIDPLFDKFPIVSYTIAALLMAFFILLFLAKLDLKKDELEKNRMDDIDKNSNGKA